MSKRYATIRERLNQIDLIRNGALSPLAAGDNAPIGSRYFGPGGEPWLKTGAVDTAWIQQLMSSPALQYQNVKDFGATGDGVTNDRTAIGNAIAAAVAAGGGVVFFPPGTYNIVRTNANPIYVLTGAAQGNIMFLGCGRSSVLSVSGNGNNGDMELFQLKNGAKYFVWKSLCFNAENIVNPGEQSHYISWLNQAVSADTETGRSLIVDCYFEYTEGDGSRLLGNQDRHIIYVHFKRNCFQMRHRVSGRGSRSCLGYQRAVRFTNVDANYMIGVRGQLIDYEPSGNGDNVGDHTTRNFLNGHQIAVGAPTNVRWTYTGNGGGSEHQKNVVEGNTLIEGSFQAFDLESTVMGNNIIEALSAEEQGTCAINERAHGIIFSGNILALVSTLTGINTLTIENHTVGDNHDICVIGNILTNGTDLSGSFGSSINDIKRLQFANNQLYVAVNVNGAGGIIRVEGPDEADDNVSIVENLGVGTDARLGIGSRAGASGPFTTGNITMSGNLFRNIDIGVRFGPDSAALRTEQLCATRNVLQANTSAVVVTGTVVPEVNIDAGGQGNGPTIFQVTSDPSGAVVANKGSFALRTNGGAGTTLYVKEANSGLNTGWAAK